MCCLSDTVRRPPAQWSLAGRAALPPVPADRPSDRLCGAAVLPAQH